MSDCSVESIRTDLEGVYDGYLKFVRAPLEGRPRIDEKDLKDALEYIAAKTLEDKKVEEALSSYDKGLMKEVEGLQIGTRKFSDIAKFTPTVFNSVEFSLEDSSNSDVYTITGGVKKRVESMIGTLANIVKGEYKDGVIVREGKGKVTDKTAGKNPALKLLLTEAFNEEKGRWEYRPNLGAMVALTASAYEVLVEGSSTLMGYKDAEQIAEIAGVSEEAVTGYLTHRFGMGALGLSQFADSVGSQTVRHLGIKTDKDRVLIEENKKLNSSLGLLAAKMLEDLGDVIEPITIDVNAVVDTAMKTSAVGVSKEKLLEVVKNPKFNAVGNLTTDLGAFGSVEEAQRFKQAYFNAISTSSKGILFDDLYKNSHKDPSYRAVHQFVVMKHSKGLNKKLEKDLGLFEDFIEDVPKQGPLFEKPDISRHYSKKRDSFSRLTKSQIEYLQVAESIPHGFTIGMEALLDLMKGKNKEEVLKKAMGYPDEREDVSFDMKQGNESRRNRIEKTIEDFFGFYEEANGRPFYYEHFVPGNNRVMIKSSTVNPHSDKELARWLTKQVEVEQTTVTAKEVYGLLDRVDNVTVEEFEGMSGPLQALVLATVQGFDGNTVNGTKVADIEKDVLKTVLRSFKDILETDIDTLGTMVLEGSGHIGQKATVYATLKALKESDKGSTDAIVSDAVFEVDGLTNALFYRIMQTPMINHGSIKEKVGVLTAEDVKSREEKLGTKVSHMGDVRASVDGTYTDNYQTLGTSVSEGIVKVFEKGNLTKEEQNLKVLVDNGLFIVEDVKNSADKAYRDFAKPGTMIVNYGAGILKITEQAMRDYIHGSMGKPGLLDKLVAKDKGKYKVTGDVLEKLLGLNAKDVEDFREAIRTKPANQLSKLPAYRVLLEAAKAGIGGPVAKKGKGREVVELKGPLPDALNDIYGNYIITSSAQIAFHNAMYTAFKARIDARFPNGFLKASESDVRAFIEENRVMFPSVARPDSVLIENYTTIIGKSTLSMAKGANNANLGLMADTAGVSPTYRYLNEMVGSLLGEDFEAPSAKGLPFRTHTQDSRDITAAAMRIYRDTGVLPLQIFDAHTVEGNSMGISKAHNEEAMLSNLRYNSFEDDVLRLGKTRNEIEIVLRPEKEDYDYFQNAVDTMSIGYDIITRERQRIYGNDQVVMQMSGLVGSRYDYIASEVYRGEVARLNEAKDSLKKLLDGKKVGDSLKSIVTQIADQIEAGEGSVSLTKLVYDASWEGLENGELADILQVIRESDTAIRTIEGKHIDEAYVAVSSTPQTPPTPTKQSEVEAMIATVKSLRTDVQRNLLNEMKGLLDGEGTVDSLLQQIYKGCKE